MMRAMAAGEGDDDALGSGQVEIVALGPTTEVVVRGEIDIATTPAFDAALEAALGADVHVLEMDLSQVTFMGSSGLAGLLRAQRLMRERGARLVLLRPSRAVADLLEMTRLLERFGLDEPGAHGRSTPEASGHQEPDAPSVQPEGQR